MYGHVYINVYIYICIWYGQVGGGGDVKGLWAGFREGFKGLETHSLYEPFKP